jgi:hypothetical protein
MTTDKEDQLRQEVRRLTQEFFPCTLAIGKVVRHPDGRMVKVIGGQYWGTHGLSNFWYWREVKEDGSLSEREESGYGWS